MSFYKIGQHQHLKLVPKARIDVSVSDLAKYAGEHTVVYVDHNLWNPVLGLAIAALDSSHPHLRKVL